jgi:GntR family transcriptional regulator, gluconate operon transcriptional repressor
MSHPSEFQKPTTLAIEVARHLREAIIKRELAPGERLNEAKLTRELKLSRSPVREAFRILEAEGLVTLEPHRGAYVPTLSEHDLREIFDVRLMFETHALRHGSLTTETLAPLRQAVTEARSALHAANFEQWHRAGVRFHDGLVGLALNGHLKRLYVDLTVSLRRYQISLISIPDQPERSQSAHETILSALEHGDLERGVDLVAEHITSLKEALLKAIAREIAD